VIDALLTYAKQAGCYKVILDCGEANVAFYEKCGLKRKEVQMVWCSAMVHFAAF
jgi:glucosamine-phosphate N-acetyltransferase